MILLYISVLFNQCMSQPTCSRPSLQFFVTSLDLLFSSGFSISFSSSSEKNCYITEGLENSIIQPISAVASENDMFACVCTCFLFSHIIIIQQPLLFL